jgi:hypothetical protein
LPESQLGFRRVLAGIYTHTSAHIVAAPMAHYMAKNMSRFRYSHDSFYMPAYGALQMMNDANMIMKFRKVGGKQVTFHQAMNYLYRPEEMENYSMYQFYQEMEFTSLAAADKKDGEAFHFTEDHPCRDHDAVMYRSANGKENCVPVFSWKFIGSTKDFERNMLMPVEETDPQFRKKEEYAQRFMIVFLPFRTNEDLKLRGSYQRAFQNAYEEDLFSEEMLAIANNIQTIQNSIESGIPDNELSARTTMPEADEFESNSDETEMGFEDLLSTIGDLFAPPVGERLDADATSLNPAFSGKQLQGRRFIPEDMNEDDRNNEEGLSTVIERRTADQVITSIHEQIEQAKKRFKTETSELNTLLLRQEKVVRDHAVAVAEGRTPVLAADACGSWQSVVKWGQIAELDTEQQLAFEILAATYVLTFYDEALNGDANRTMDRVPENRARLVELSRRDATKEAPLRMFVTGPAGAGKCKLQTTV